MLTQSEIDELKDLMVIRDLLLRDVSFSNEIISEFAWGVHRMRELENKRILHYRNNINDYIRTF